MGDVTIMGAGVFGLALAYACARRGARVHLMDQRGPGAGSSGGIVGALAPHVPENWNAKKAFQFDALMRAQDFWRSVATLSGQDTGYARLGRVQPVPDGKLDLAHAREAGAAALWQGAAQWRVLPSSSAPGLTVTAPSGWVVHDTLTARVHPRRACGALLAAFQGLGGHFTLGAQPQADAPVVWATGHEGLADLSRDLGRAVGSGVKGQAALLAYRAPDAPQIFADGLHIVPHGDGTIAVGSTSEREFDAPDTVDAQCDMLVARARAVCPALADAPVVDRWAGVRPRASTRAPLMGVWPGKPGQFMFNGGFKIGFAMAPVLAEVMADLVLDGVDRIPAEFRLLTGPKL